MDGNKSIITQIAIKLFAQRGYGSVGVQEICEMADVTKPTLYYYFKSKQGLLECIVSEKGEELVYKITEALEYRHDFVYSLTQILKTEIEFAAQNPDFFNLHCVLMNSPDGSEEKTVYEPVIAQIEKLFADFFINSCNEFGNMRGSEMLYSTMFHNTVLSTVILIQNGKLEYSDQLIYKIIKSVVYGIAS